MKRRMVNLKYLQTDGQNQSETTPKPALPMPARIMGIDAALRSTGYGMIEAHSPDHLQIVDCGVVRTSKDQLLSECLRRLRGGICEVLATMKPVAAAMESGFFYRNAKTAMVLGAARGVVISAIAEQNIPIYEYAPRQIKQAICGYGNADKYQVAMMVAQFLGIDLDAVDSDATDALAVALCHISLATRHGGLFLPAPS